MLQSPHTSQALLRVENMPHRNLVRQDGRLGGSLRGSLRLTRCSRASPASPWAARALSGPMANLYPPTLPQALTGGSRADPPCATSWRGEGDPQGPKAPHLSCRRRAEAQSRGHVSRKETLARRQGVWEYLGRGWGGAGGGAPELFRLLHPHPTCIPPLSPEIRMSKPLEAEKQGLDSPSEHTGEWGREQGGQRSPRAEGRCTGGVLGVARDNSPCPSPCRHGKKWTRH